MKAKQFETSRLYRQIADHLESRIREGEFAVSGRLPTERHLTAELGVSRQTVREAFVALEMAGLIEIRGGSGVYIKEVRVPEGASSSLDNLSGPGPMEVIDARIAFEPEVAAAAARRIDNALLERLSQAVEDLIEEHRRNSNIERADRLFHMTLAEATQNALMLSTVTAVWEHVTQPMYLKMQQLANTAQWRLEWISDHQGIFHAVATRNPRQARSLMRKHLEKVKTAMQRPPPSAT